MTQLENLSVKANFIKFLPANLGKLNQLKRLYLDDNVIEFLNLDGTHLCSLKVLSVPGNKLQNLSPEFAGLRQYVTHKSPQLTKIRLEILDLSKNQFHSIPSFILQSLTELKRLKVSYNNLRSLPIAIRGLSKLQTLSCEGKHELVHWRLI